MRPSRLARHRRKLLAAAALLAAPALAHLGIAAATRIEPPPIRAAAGEPEAGPGGLRVLGPAYVRRRGRILEARLSGSPEEIGHQHGRLFYPEMAQNEGTLYEQFHHYVPVAPLRWLIMDLSRLEFRDVDQGMTEGVRREIAAQARAFSPDPFDGVLPTYHRFVFLQSLYDIALSFEHSPLIGCTSFALTGTASADGHAVLARNFDFEAGPVFDEGKAVFLVHEQGKIPYASVSWPGLIGAVTGMNAAGLALVVHGGRAGEPRAAGEPVVHTMREVLGRARNVDEALAILEARAPMVSHLVMLVDAGGEAAIAERAPGAPLHARRGRGKVPLTNHFEGPLAGDPRNLRVLAETSTRPRRAASTSGSRRCPRARRSRRRSTSCATGAGAAARRCRSATGARSTRSSPPTRSSWTPRRASSGSAKAPTSPAASSASTSPGCSIRRSTRRSTRPSPTPCPKIRCSRAATTPPGSAPAPPTKAVSAATTILK
ncbi:C45 family autoproteolytic acyltransferase/hydolase [Sorangium atrum]|uniref:C45 family autoproteolytic acyltransferase/hydrolase n=1 Tax=Sorangium atrum TaxID=2995308 RepID=A0ABT5CL36_9BACT|nr:C45 family peptidase [Sorangium aterium]MDC0685792.1 C45 family autoproteolytic acyltransferase/hydrolase [Sorangium aterium]